MTGDDTFPVDPDTLDLLSAALDPRDPCPACHGQQPAVDSCESCATFGTVGVSLHGVLDLIAGRVGEGPMDGDEYVGGPLWGVTDVLAALVAEVRRLRGTP